MKKRIEKKCNIRTHDTQNEDTLNANQQKGTRFYVKKALEVDATNLTKRIDKSAGQHSLTHNL